MTMPPLYPAALHLYGLLIACAILIALLLCLKEEKRLGMPKDTAIDILLYALPPAVIGARIYYVVFNWAAFRDAPLTALYLWQGGLAIYGGVIGGALGIWWLSRRRRISYAMLADVIAPALLLGQAIGRWGNYFNGEAFGFTVTDPVWQFFPFAVHVNGGWHLATFFYESMWNLLGFVFLYTNRCRFQRGGRFGHVFLWYLLWYGVGRLCIEGLRTDSLMLGSIRVSQLLSLLLCVEAGIKLIFDLKAGMVLLVLPVAALLCAVLIPGWYGICGAALLIVALGVLLYWRYSHPVHDR